MAPQSEVTTGHVGDTNGHHMGHHFVGMGHQMGHHFAQMGHQMGHHSAKMGHERTPMDTKMVSHFVMVKNKAGGGVCGRFSEAEWRKNQLKVA